MSGANGSVVMAVVMVVVVAEIGRSELKQFLHLALVGFSAAWFVWDSGTAVHAKQPQNNAAHHRKCHAED